MDNKEVYLTISINYDGKTHTKKSSDFISFEDIKNISKNKFNISEEDYKYMKLSFKNDTNNETIFIENDADIIFKSTEKDENNYEIAIDLTIDKIPSIQIQEEKKEEIKEEQNENNNKNNIIKAETIDENNKNKELMDNKGDNINMSCNHNDKNLILNKDKKDEKNQKLAKYLKKLAILKYKKIINELENEINDEDNKIKDVLIKKENINTNQNNQINIVNDDINININEKIPLKKQFEICNRNFFSFKSLNIEQLKKLGEEQKNCLKLIFKDIKEKPQKFSEEMDNYNNKIQKELEKYFSIVNENFSSLIEKYKIIINNYEDNQKKIIKELQEIKKQLDHKKKEEKINLAPNKNIKEENGDTPFGNKNVNPNINDVLNNQIK